MGTPLGYESCQAWVCATGESFQNGTTAATAGGNHGRLFAMPESRGRQRQRARRRTYVPPPPVKKRRESPRWYGFVTLGFMAVGVAIIVWNYMRGDSADPTILFVGLGLIAVGFALATRWR